MNQQNLQQFNYAITPVIAMTGLVKGAVVTNYLTRVVCAVGKYQNILKI